MGKLEKLCIFFPSLPLPTQVYRLHVVIPAYRTHRMSESSPVYPSFFAAGIAPGVLYISTVSVQQKIEKQSGTTVVSTLGFLGLPSFFAR